MEYRIIFVCLLMQLQTILCYSFIFDKIFITFFKIKHKLYVILGSTPTHQCKILGACLPLYELHNFSFCYLNSFDGL